MHPPLRMVARLLTASTYVLLGADAGRASGARVDQAAPMLAAVRNAVPLPVENGLIVRGTTPCRWSAAHCSLSARRPD
jgi:putative oxidoreductase